MTEKNTSIRTKTRHPADFLTYIAIYVCAIISVALLLGIIIYVFAKGIRSVNWEFLTSVTSVLKGTTGIAGNIVNTLYIIIVTMLIATPIGVGAAVYLNEYAKPGKLVSLIEFATETLAGIPSIIFGTAGSSGLLPKSFADLFAKAKMPAGTLTIQLYLSATKGEFGVAFGIAVVLLMIVLGINLLTKALAKKFDVNRR